MNTYERYEEKIFRSLPKNTGELLADFFKAKRLNVHTRISYIKAVESYIQAVGKQLQGMCNQSLTKWYSSLNGKRAPGTMFLYAIKLRAVYRFNLEKKGMDEEEANLRAKRMFKAVPIKTLRKDADKQNRLKDKLVPKEEFQKLLNSAHGPMMRAFLMVCYESAARLNELLKAKIRDLEFHKRYALLRIDGKTGERTVPLIHSIPYLRAWIQVHPDRSNPEAALFAASKNGEAGFPSEAMIKGRFVRLGKTARLSRRVHPHMLRHTKLTELASKGIGEFQLKQFAGWVLDSKMASRYVHLAGREALNAVLEIEGIREPKKHGVNYAETKTCPRCDAENEHDAIYCISCGLYLDDQALHKATAERQETDDLMTTLIQHPRIQEAIKDTVRELIEANKLKIMTP